MRALECRESQLGGRKTWEAPVWMLVWACPVVGEAGRTRHQLRSRKGGAARCIRRSFVA